MQPYERAIRADIWNRLKAAVRRVNRHAPEARRTTPTDVTTADRARRTRGEFITSFEDEEGFDPYLKRLFYALGWVVIRLDPETLSQRAEQNK
jgi:hypothetical protein